MTDANLEPAARRLCEIRGIDPDSLSPVMGWNRPRWKHVIPEIRAHMEREQALRETDGGYQFVAIGYKAAENIKAAATTKEDIKP